MTKNLVALAEMDHDCRGFDGCNVCREAFFARSRQKWQRLQDKWEQVRQRSKRAYQPDAMIVSAIMSPTEEEKEEKQNANA